MIGLGIGSEYAAINSAVDELIPARPRGLALGLTVAQPFLSMGSSSTHGLVLTTFYHFQEVRTGIDIFGSYRAVC